MDVSIYAIRDVLVGFGPLFFEPSHDVAIRNFSRLADNDTCPFTDYDLYFLGTYHLKTGKIEPLDSPELVCHGTSLVRKEDKSDAVE